MDTKKWYQSKTIWFNVLAIAGAIFTMASEQLSQGAGTGVILINAGNILLRFVTNKPLGGDN
ncbi:MAG TPA: hypothetical protein VLB82_05445 [Thermodesulfobacteriota bacterium]|nr:hypothetical protein [Thermodesulfobacteriota bacterium]